MVIRDIDFFSRGDAEVAKSLLASIESAIAESELRSPLPASKVFRVGRRPCHGQRLTCRPEIATIRRLNLQQAAARPIAPIRYRQQDNPRGSGEGEAPPLPSDGAAMHGTSAHSAGMTTYPLRRVWHLLTPRSIQNILRNGFCQHR